MVLFKLLLCSLEDSYSDPSTCRLETYPLFLVDLNLIIGPRNVSRLLNGVLSLSGQICLNLELVFLLHFGSHPLDWPLYLRLLDLAWLLLDYRWLPGDLFRATDPTCGLRSVLC